EKAFDHLQKVHFDLVFAVLTFDSPTDLDMYACQCQVVDVNLTAVLNGTRVAIQHMPRGGVIVNTASMAGKSPVCVCVCVCGCVCQPFFGRGVRGGHSNLKTR